jgi:ubiquitin carboxyl-terminal hydrolase 34
VTTSRNRNLNEDLVAVHTLTHHVATFLIPAIIIMPFQPVEEARDRTSSGEDAELPTHDRKRPRLSDGTDDKDAARQDHMKFTSSSEIQSMTENPSTGEHAASNLAQLTPPPRPHETVTSHSPRNKMTINTRPLSSQSIHVDGQSGQPAMSHDHAHAQTTVSNAGSGQHLEHLPPLQTIDTVERTPSPEIEIAEPEDYDEDPARTRWTTRIGGDHPSMQSYHFYQTFPFAKEHNQGEARYAINTVSRLLADPRKDSNGEIFLKVKDWLVQFTMHCEAMAPGMVEDEYAFWLRLPLVMNGLLDRDQRTQPPMSSDDIVDFFVAWLKLCQLVIEYDELQMAPLDPSQVVDNYHTLTSYYLKSCTPILDWLLDRPVDSSQLQPAAFLENLRRYHSFDFATLTRRVGEILAGGAISALARYCSLLCGLLPYAPALSEDLLRVVSALTMVVQLLSAQVLPLFSSSDSSSTTTEQLSSSMLQAFESIDTIIQEAIRKQQVWLSNDNASNIFSHLHHVLFAIPAFKPALGMKIIQNSGIQPLDGDLTNLEHVVASAWKLMTCWNCIKHGRMALRATGVQMMCNELVHIYQSKIVGQPDGKRDPQTMIAVRFLRDNRVVDYIVGVDSHAQLIGRAGNIVGYFGVTGAYEDSDTNMIWNAMVSSPDQQISIELVRVLDTAVSTVDGPMLAGFLRKLMDFPVARWNSAHLQLFRNVMDAVTKPTHVQWARSEGYVLARTACLKLLRDVFQPEHCNIDIAPTIRDALMHILLNILHSSRGGTNGIGLSEKEETEMMAQVQADLVSHSPNVCGSIFTLTHIVQQLQLSPISVSSLAEKCSMPMSLIDDIAYFNDASKQTEIISHQQRLIQLEIRLDGLAVLFRMIPDSFDDQSMSGLWNRILTSPILEDDMRARAWNSLTIAMDQAKKTRNSVIDRILEDFWPQLRPADISIALLEFAKQSVIYESALSYDDVQAQETVEPPGLARVQRIMLNAPTGTVESSATDFLIQQHLHSPTLTRRPKAVVHAAHLDLIDRWVDTVLGSAARLESFMSVDEDQEDSMQVLATEDEIRQEELRFDRSLLFLRRFTEAIKANPGCSPISPRHSGPLPMFPDKRGTNCEIMIESSSNKYIASGEPRKAIIGSENTGAELWKYLADVTGFRNFKAFHKGQQIVLQNASETLEALNISGKIQVQRTPDSAEAIPAANTRSSSPIDGTIMAHFDDLYSLLESRDRLAKEVYAFLSVTPIRNEISQKMRSMESPMLELLPMDKPYKLLFCTQALRTSIEEESFSATPDTHFVTSAIQALVGALVRLRLDVSHNLLYLSIAFEMIDALLLAFRTKVPHSIGKAFITDPSQFVSHMLRYLGLVAGNEKLSLMPDNPTKPIRAGLDALVEACLHDEHTWTILEATPVFPQLLQSVLFDNDEHVRQIVTDIMTGMTGQTSSKDFPKSNDPRAARSRHDSTVIVATLLKLWKLLLNIFPTTMHARSIARHYFDALLGILKRVGKDLSIEVLRDTFARCKSTLLDYRLVEVVGLQHPDQFLAGNIAILTESARLLRVQQALLDESMLAQSIFSRLLFPPFSDGYQSQGHYPVVDSAVRGALYDLLSILCQDNPGLEVLVALLNDDIVVSDVSEDHYEVANTSDRLSLRSEVGYAGLRNLSNTCYLNSLLSQLFMNILFRDFIINSKADPRKQKLLHELGSLFANMQSSFDRSIDPTEAVASIRTWEGHNIDVTVQMDVDEFFNLLFDRLESQTSSAASKRALSAFFGGETIQQIKSKECEHVSERPESFSVLPVEIKGKHSLLESLEAYVEGEVLQGDNKYSCTACGKHVDAVKRSCLRNVPDNLIFNLKRFDFDIVNCIRAKLNDHFEFPEVIDMAPYKLENLSGQGLVSGPDFFELTGVIIHSGSAETGHYYSLTRQTSGGDGAGSSWVQFNDSDVTHLDSSLLGDSCFGGTDNSGIYSMPKFYNAYMLFYQRRSTLQHTKQLYPIETMGSPVRLVLDEGLAGDIRRSNELFLRAYCLQDPSHARLVRETCQRMQKATEVSCSEEHKLEDAVIDMALQYVHLVSSRWKALPEMEATMDQIKSMVVRCASCAKHALSWLSQDASRVIDCVVRTAYAPVRKQWTLLIRLALETVVPLPETYMSAMSSLGRILDYLKDEKQLVCRLSRCWTDLFQLLPAICDIGTAPARFVIQAGFLEFCAEIALLHTLDSETHRDEKLQHFYHAYTLLRRKHRIFDHDAMAVCFDRLLNVVDLDLDPRGGLATHGRQVLGQVPGLSLYEVSLLEFHDETMRLPWLERLIRGRQAYDGVKLLIARFANEKRFHISHRIVELLQVGMHSNDLGVAGCHLGPVVDFCEHCQDRGEVYALVRYGLNEVGSIGLDYGLEYIRWIQQLLKIRDADGDRHLRRVLLKGVCAWAPTLLIARNDVLDGADIRGETVAVLQDVLFAEVQDLRRLASLSESSQQRLTSIRRLARKLAQGIANAGYDHFLMNPNTRGSNNIQVGHFTEASDVVRRCIDLAQEDASDAAFEDETGRIEQVMATLRQKSDLVMEIASAQEFDGSSDLEALSEGDADDYHKNSPA